MNNAYTASEAAAKLGLNYYAFLARVRRGQYTYTKHGDTYAFDRNYIDGEAEKAEGVSTCS